MKNQDSTVLITGGSRGIGRSLVTHLAKYFKTIVTTSTTSEGVEKAKKSYMELGLSNVIVFHLDLANKDSIEAFLAELKEQSILIDSLINNAGITRDNISLKMSHDQWHDVINVNLNGTFYLTKGLLRNMLKKRYGRVIFISSVVAAIGNPGQANYCAAKSGVLGLMRSLAVEYASKGITVNAISPGFIETDMTNVLNEQQRNLMLNNIPTKTFGKPKDIAHAAKFLISHEANYITGQNLHVNGGLYIT